MKYCILKPERRIKSLIFKSELLKVDNHSFDLKNGKIYLGKQRIAFNISDFKNKKYSNFLS